jgi:hypothetical protein
VDWIKIVGLCETWDIVSVRGRGISNCPRKYQLLKKEESCCMELAVRKD